MTWTRLWKIEFKNLQNITLTDRNIHLNTDKGSFLVSLFYNRVFFTSKNFEKTMNSREYSHIIWKLNCKLTYYWPSKNTAPSLTSKARRPKVTTVVNYDLSFPFSFLRTKKSLMWDGRVVSFSTPWRGFLFRGYDVSTTLRTQYLKRGWLWVSVILNNKIFSPI